MSTTTNQLLENLNALVAGLFLLTGFGIVRQVAFDNTGQAPTLAGTALVFATPQYMAPEQFTGAYVDQRGDGRWLAQMTLANGKRKSFMARHALRLLRN